MKKQCNSSYGREYEIEPPEETKVILDTIIKWINYYKNQYDLLNVPKKQDLDLLLDIYSENEPNNLNNIMTPPIYSDWK